jgi:acyl-CoA thioester hydrolase
MSSIFEYAIEVRDSDIDVLGHVNNVVYIQWMQNAAYAHSAALGWTLERYLSLGAGWVARLHQIEYLQPAFAGQRVIVKTWVADMKKVTSMRRYRMVRMDLPMRETLLAVAHTNWAFIDYKRGTPIRIPAEMSVDFPLVIDPK